MEREHEFRRKMVAKHSAEALKASREEVEAKKKSLVSDVKKTTGFVKKVRTISEDNGEVLAQEACRLNLRRYVSEIVSGLSDAPIRPKDVPSVMHLVCVVHQRYDEFAEPLMHAINAEFATIEESLEKKDVLRRRVLLKLAIEMVLCGVVETPPFALKLLRRMTRVPVQNPQKATELSNLAACNLQGIVGALKTAGIDLLGIVPKSVSEEQAMLLSSLFVISAEQQERSRQMMLTYKSSLMLRIEREHVALKKRTKRNKEETLNRGSLSEKSAQIFGERKIQLQKLMEGAQGLAELLHCEMVNLSEEDDEDEEKNEEVSLWSRPQVNTEDLQTSLDVWMYDDEETRAFYQDIPELAQTLPAALLVSTSSNLLSKTARALAEKREEELQEAAAKHEEELAARSATAKPAIGTSPERQNVGIANKGTLDDALSQLTGSKPKSKDIGPAQGKTSNLSAGGNAVSAFAARRDVFGMKKSGEDPASEIDEDEDEEMDADDGEDDPVGQLSQSALQIDELMTRLPNCLSRLATEKFAVDFCHLNNKKAMKRLIKELQRAPWSRSELVPYYSRIAAILSKIFPRIGQELIAYLEKEFKGLMKKEDSKVIDSRLKNVRYIGELVKFGDPEDLGVPPEKAFFVWTNCFKEFRGGNVEVACALFETAGRYLFRNESTHKETARYVQQLVPFLESDDLSKSEKNLIENAFFYVVPPERTSRQVKWRSDEEKFVRYLFFEFLKGHNDENHFQDKVDDIQSVEMEIEGKEKRSMTQKRKRRGKISKGRDQINFVVMMLRKLDWSGDKMDETLNMLSKCVLAVGRKQVGNVGKVCDVIACLSSTTHPNVGVKVVDTTLELLEASLEENDSSKYQRALGYACVLAELSNHRLVDWNSFFDSLFLILHHGHSLAWPQHQRESPLPSDPSEWTDDDRAWRKKFLTERERRPRGPNHGGCIENDASKFHPAILAEKDPPHECFRLRLVCRILDTSCDFLKSPRFSSRISRLWLYVERYRLAKDYIPLEVEFALEDTYERLNRPVAERPRTLVEAEERLKQLELSFDAQQLQHQQVSPSLSAGEYSFQLFEDDLDLNGEEEHSGADTNDADELGEFEDEDDNEDEEDDDFDEELEDDGISLDESSVGSDEEDSAERERNLRTAEDEAFELEFARLMQETSKTARRSRTRNTGTNMDEKMAVPRGIFGSTQQNANVERSNNEVSFKLLKRGPKGNIEAASVQLPSNSKIVRSIEKAQEEEARERELIKQKVVEYGSREAFEETSFPSIYETTEPSEPRKASNTTAARARNGGRPGARARGKHGGRGRNQASQYERTFS